MPPKLLPWNGLALGDWQFKCKPQKTGVYCVDIKEKGDKVIHYFSYWSNVFRSWGPTTKSTNKAGEAVVVETKWPLRLNDVPHWFGLQSPPPSNMVVPHQPATPVDDRFRNCSVLAAYGEGNDVVIILLDNTTRAVRAERIYEQYMNPALRALRATSRALHNDMIGAVLNYINTPRKKG